MQRLGSVHDAMQALFPELDRKLLSSTDMAKQYHTVGATAAVAYLDLGSNMLHTASLGNCLCVLGRTTGSFASATADVLVLSGDPRQKEVLARLVAVAQGKLPPAAGAAAAAATPPLVPPLLDGGGAGAGVGAGQAEEQQLPCAEVLGLGYAKEGAGAGACLPASCIKQVWMPAACCMRSISGRLVWVMGWVRGWVIVW